MTVVFVLEDNPLPDVSLPLASSAGLVWVGKVVDVDSETEVMVEPPAVTTLVMRMMV